MKRSGLVTVVLAAMMMITFTACQDDSNELTTDLETLELESDAATESSYESVDELVEVAFEIVDANESSRVANDVLGDCVEVTHDAENKTITIDYGDGCEGRLGNVWSGKIVVEYNMRVYEPGAYRIITFVDLFFNEIGIEGVRTITNTSTQDDVREFTVELEGGKLDFGDDVFITRDAQWIRKWYVGEGKVTLSGVAEGVNINGFDYSATVSAETPLTFLRECARLIPVSGIKELVVGDRSATLDYGDGECDRLVEVTTNGETLIREINPRRGRR